MGALENFKLKMEEQRRARTVIPSLDQNSKNTVQDIKAIVNVILHNAARTDLPDGFSNYCRQRYTPFVNSLHYAIDDNFLNFNMPTQQQLIDNPISIADCQNDSLTFFYEPSKKSVFVDKENNKNNLRIEKLVGQFQFYPDNCKLRLFRQSSELDCTSESEEENENAHVLNFTWTVEPYYVTLPKDFLERYIAGEDYEPELFCIIENATPPDEELIAFLTVFLKILKTTLYSIKKNLNRYCRLTDNILVKNLKGNKSNVPISLLQLMEFEVEGLNDKGRAVHKQKQAKAKTPRKPRVKPHKRK